MTGTGVHTIDWPPVAMDAPLGIQGFYWAGKYEAKTSAIIMDLISDSIVFAGRLPILYSLNTIFLPFVNVHA